MTRTGTGTRTATSSVRDSGLQPAPADPDAPDAPGTPGASGQTDGEQLGRLVRAMRRLNTELTASNRAVASRTGLNESDLAVLEILHQEGPTAPAALARRTRIPAATMTNVLARLERDGWVERRPDTTDRRSAQIHPTGTARLTALYGPANTGLTTLLHAMPDDHAQAVLDFLEDACQVIQSAAADVADRTGPTAT